MQQLVLGLMLGFHLGQTIFGPCADDGLGRSVQGLAWYVTVFLWSCDPGMEPREESLINATFPTYIYEMTLQAC